MAEWTTRSGTGATAHSETLRSFSDQAIEAGREFNDKAGAGNKNLKDQASGLANEAKEIAGAGDRNYQASGVGQERCRRRLRGQLG